MSHFPTAVVLVLACLQTPVRAQENTAPPFMNPRLEWAGPLRAEHRVAAGVLRAARRANESGEALLQRLVALDVAGIPVLLDILEQGRIPRVVPEDPAQILNEAQGRLLMSALSALPEPGVRAELETRLAASPQSASPRLATLKVLAAIGDRGDLPRLGGIAPHRDGALPQDARVALRAAYAAILGRDPELLLSAGELVNPKDLVSTRELLLAAGELGDPRALGLLETCARSYPALAQLAVSIVPEVGRSSNSELDRSFSEWLGCSIDRQRPEWTRVALRAVGVLDDGNAVDELIAALEMEEDGIAASAHDALQRISGLKLEPDPVVWRSWWKAEQTWMDCDRERARRVLDSGDTSDVLQALARYAEHRLFRDELSGDVLVVLGRRESGLQRLACETLERLGSRCALEPLMELFGSGNAPVADAAWKAACTISGRTLPRDTNESRALLAGG